MLENIPPNSWEEGVTGVNTVEQSKSEEQPATDQ
jgi:hypothetical protein